MIASLEQRGSFSGHQTFSLRYAWLWKAVNHVLADPRVFAADDAMVRFGVGRNMVHSMRHWGLACGMLEVVAEGRRTRDPMLSVSELGKKLFGPEDPWDPYLEDPASLWLLHWELCSTSELATTWHWVFSHLPQPEFSKGELLNWIAAQAEQRGLRRVTEKSLGRDIDCFLRTYVPSRASRTVSIEDTLDCPLVELGLIREFGGRGNYLLVKGDQPTLPDHLFAYGIARFLAERHTNSGTMSIESLAFSPGSPGRIFNLTEDALLFRLEHLDAVTGGRLAYDETAGLRQVLIRKQMPPLEILEEYYREEVATKRPGRSR